MKFIFCNVSIQCYFDKLDLVFKCDIRKCYVPNTVYELATTLATAELTYSS